MSIEVYFEVGDTVYHQKYGKGVVTTIELDNEYPVIVQFDDVIESFTNDGQLFIGSGVKLFQQPFPINVVKKTMQYFPYKKGDFVLVSNNGKEWFPAVFFEAKEHCFTIGYYDNKGQLKPQKEYWGLAKSFETD